MASTPRPPCSNGVSVPPVMSGPPGLDACWPRWWTVRRTGSNGTRRVRDSHPGCIARRIRRAGVLVALAIGDQQAIAPTQWTVFTRTGVNHLMSISGLHITMCRGARLRGAVLWVWRRSSRLVSRLPAQKAAALAGLATAFGYALLSGYGVPAQRTVYMLAVVAGGLLVGLGLSALDILAMALLVVLLLDPWAVLAAGFWLSFGAVALIMYVSAGRLSPPGWLVNWARVQWAITVGLVPLLVALFQQISIVSPLANALAIPLVSLAVVPLTLLGLVLPWDWCWSWPRSSCRCATFLTWFESAAGRGLGAACARRGRFLWRCSAPFGCSRRAAYRPAGWGWWPFSAGGVAPQAPRGRGLGRRAGRRTGLGHSGAYGTTYAVL